jgi:hypothetical protein
MKSIAKKSSNEKLSLNEYDELFDELMNLDFQLHNDDIIRYANPIKAAEEEKEDLPF